MRNAATGELLSLAEIKARLAAGKAADHLTRLARQEMKGGDAATRITTAAQDTPGDPAGVAAVVALIIAERHRRAAERAVRAGTPSQPHASDP